MIDNKVKLVVWDLDETFWKGTLTEGGITHVESNIEMVRELSRRGIVNSICSKNDYEQVKAKLLEREIWDYFVFPSISFNPKGGAIAEMIEGAALRPQNVLFLDDNPSNLEEAKFFNPGIMTAHPVDVLDGLLDHPNMAGKPDPELTRLKQYQFLQRKVDERGASTLSNEEFLRASNIRIAINHDVGPNLDRVIELINRTNQLNYTKIRLETEEGVQGLRDSLVGIRSYAGTVHVVDDYGDYGLVGFYLGVRRPGLNKLTHFVFSCRTMNMGIEQYVYEMLGCPEIEIAKPVSYGLKTHDRVDWITIGDIGETSSASAPLAERLVLLGGCDLLQLASYCSTDRIEFVNFEKAGSKIRYDDPGFVLTDRTALKNSEAVGRFPWWTYEDAVRFDQGVASAKLILLSLWPGMNGRYFQIGQGMSVRFTSKAAEQIRRGAPEFFDANFEALEPDDDKRLALIMASFDAIGAKCRNGARIFSLGCYTRGLDSARGRRRVEYNKACRDYCERRPELFRFIDVDAIVPPEALANDTHFTRAGYYALAQYVLGVMRGNEPRAPVRSEEDQPVRRERVRKRNRKAAPGEPSAAEDVRGRPGAASEERKARNSARRAERNRRREERRGSRKSADHEAPAADGNPQNASTVDA